MKHLKTFLFGGSTPNSMIADLGFTILRVFTGLAMAIGHGWGKIPPSEGFIENVEGMGFPMPVMFAWGAALSEFAGGLLLAAGFLTRPAAFFICFTMMVAAFVVHAEDPLFMGQGASKEPALLYAAIALAYLFAGSGRISVDAMIRR